MLLVVGSAVMILESFAFVFDGFFVFTILAAVSLLWSARRLSSARRTIGAPVVLSNLD
jgi:hypothetical protein